jgi:hypothetical protein
MEVSGQLYAPAHYRCDAFDRTVGGLHNRSGRCEEGKGGVELQIISVIIIAVLISLNGKKLTNDYFSSRVIKMQCNAM